MTIPPSVTCVTLAVPITPAMPGVPGDLHVSDAPVAAPPQVGPHDPEFLQPLVLEYIDGHCWRVTSEFDYYTRVAPVWLVHVPAGFETDFASVPRLLWNVFSPTGSYGKAAVVHDYLYRTPGIATKREADDIFNEAMQALGTGWFTRNTLYLAVKWFGGSSYKGGLR